MARCMNLSIEHSISVLQPVPEKCKEVNDLDEELKFCKMLVTMFNITHL